MKDRLIILGGLVCAVTCLIPIINKSGEYSEIEILLNSSGQYLGSGLVILGSSIKSRHWPYLRTIAVLLLSLGTIWLYDNLIDVGNKIHTYHYTVIIGLITLITLTVCLFIKLRRHSI